MDRRWRSALGKLLLALFMAALGVVQQFAFVLCTWYVWEDYRLNREIGAVLPPLLAALALTFCVQLNACILRRLFVSEIERFGPAFRKYGSFGLWGACVLLSLGVLVPACMDSAVFTVISVLVMMILLLIPGIRSAFLWDAQGQWGFRFWEALAAVLYLLIGKAVASEDLQVFGSGLVPVLVGSTATGFLLYQLRKRLRGVLSWEGKRRVLWCAGNVGAGVLLLVGVYAARFWGDVTVTPRQDADGSYLIHNREGFEWAVERSAWDRDIDIRLTGDILLNDVEHFADWGEEPPEHQYEVFPMLFEYEGTFDGNGYALVGYYPKSQNAVFGTIGENGCVKNLTLRDSWFDVPEQSFDRTLRKGGAALCYDNEGTIVHCTVDATVRGSVTGGIVYENSGTVSECSFTGQLESSGRAGGIALYNYPGGIIEACSNTGEIRWTGENAEESDVLAGICEYNVGEIRSCFHTGEIVAEHFPGTIRGIADNVSVITSRAVWGVGETENCYRLADGMWQEEPQEGVYVLTGEEMADIASYLSGEKRVAAQTAGEREETTPEDASGEEVCRYIVQKGDCLWKIAEYFYGNGSEYTRLKREDGESPGAVIYPGEVLLVPEKL